MTSLRHRPWTRLLLGLGALVFFGSREPPAPIGPLAGQGPRALRPPPPLPTPHEAPEPIRAPTRRARPAPSEAPAPRRGPVRVRVVGPGELALPGVFVAARGLTDRRLEGAVVGTDEQGEAVLADVPYDGSRLVHVYARDPDRGGAQVWVRLDAWGRTDNVQPVTGPELLYRAATGLLLTVHAVNAETGDDLDGVRLRAQEGRRATDRVWGPAPGRFLLAPPIGRPTPLTWTLEPPAGFVAWERPWLSVAVSPYARELVATTPLRHEVAVTLLPREADGGPARVEILGLQVADRTPDWAFRGDALGRIHLGGVPFLRDEIVDVRLCRPDRSGPTRVWGVIPDHPAAGLDLEVTVPTAGSAAAEPRDGGIRTGGSASTFVTTRARTTWPTTLLVQVRRRDGAPAVGATVALGGRQERTDATGLARFQNVPPGPVDLAVRQVGLLPLARGVQVAAQGETRVELVEGAGGALEVLVVDGDHQPLAYAALTLTLPSGQPWIDMEGARQRLDPYTDHQGRRVLGGLETGSIDVTASWGSRHVTQTLSITAGGTARATFVLQRPTAPGR